MVPALQASNWGRRKYPGREPAGKPAGQAECNSGPQKMSFGGPAKGQDLSSEQEIQNGSSFGPIH